MTHLLDTDICIGVLRKRPGLAERLSRLSPADCAVSMVTVYELLSGIRKAKEPEKEREKVERFVAAIIELPLDRSAAEEAARIRADLERLGTPIGPYDLLIAGQALASNLMASNLTLVSNNVQEFQRVAGLRIESWT
jgi:tRNA(fMet)-specific endonuclease VapC